MTFDLLSTVGIAADFEPASGGRIVCKSGHGIVCGGGVVRMCPCRSVSIRSGSFARCGSDKISAQRSRLNVRWLAFGCLAGVVGVWALCASGLRISGTHSEPVGIYLGGGQGAGQGRLREDALSDRIPSPTVSAPVPAALRIAIDVAPAGPTSVPSTTNVSERVAAPPRSGAGS
jgi:hypothetical protein